MYISAPPPAAALVESLRGIGYSTATALADIIDNSIAANADRVRLDFHWRGESSFITIFDNGHGMDADELTTAMRLGACSPLDDRAEGDLGRFGLGLKTASFSQCRRLTVTSKKQHQTASVRCWDLDHITNPEINDWQLMTFPAHETSGRLGHIDKAVNGTLVVWEKLDRILNGLPANADTAMRSFLAVAERAEQHLAMVFHRYLEGTKPRLSLFVNGGDESHRVKPWDPFLADHTATWSTPEETIRSPEGNVSLRGFVLPHKDRLDQHLFRTAAGPDGWTAQQGFYIYRNGRMVVSGNWLGLGEGRAWTKEEQFRLARLKLEFPNSLDRDWEIDIRKSRARPPAYIKERLRDLAKQVRQMARRIYAHRGSYGPRQEPIEVRHIWRSVEHRESIRYQIDRTHPAVDEVLKSINGNKNSLERLLSLIELTVPVRRIWLDEAERVEVSDNGEPLPETQKLRPIVLGMLKHLVEGCGYMPKDAREEIKRTEPFHFVPDLVDEIFDEFFGDDG